MNYPARVKVITSMQSSHAIILRRGPSNFVATIGWDRETDEFTMGQWLIGRICAYRSDLSPDGRHFIYFAGKGSMPPKIPWWTAISRAPYLKAVYFQPEGDTWLGGGAFTNRRTFWINGRGKPPKEVEGILYDPDPASTEGYCKGNIYVTRMQNRGWVAQEAGDGLVLLKKLSGRVTLKRQYRSRSSDPALAGDVYSALLNKPIREIEFSEWEWADIWNDRLCFTEGGKLWSGRISANGDILEKRCLRDFNDMKFKRINAPYDVTTSDDPENDEEITWHQLDREDIQ